MFGASTCWTSDGRGLLDLLDSFLEQDDEWPNADEAVRDLAEQGEGRPLREPGELGATTEQARAPRRSGRSRPCPLYGPMGGKGGEFELEGRAVEEVEIEVRESGPYRVRGPVRVVDADGNEYDVSQKIVREGEDGFVALCRCGGSSIKPFCDGTHKRNGFRATEREPDGIWRRPPPHR